MRSGSVNVIYITLATSPFSIVFVSYLKRLRFSENRHRAPSTAHSPTALHQSCAQSQPAGSQCETAGNPGISTPAACRWFQLAQIGGIRTAGGGSFKPFPGPFA